MNDLGPLPTIHERHVPVEMARRELDTFLIELAKKHNLTSAEHLSLLAGAMQNRLASHIKEEREE